MLRSVSVIDIAKEFAKTVEPQTALEIGSGEGGILASFDIPCKVGVDNYAPSLWSSMSNFPNLVPLKWDVLRLMEIFLPKAFELVLGFDILEHFESQVAASLIETAELLASKAVLFWGPLEKEPSVSAIIENPGQVHHSILTTMMFDARGYEVIRFPHYFRNGRVDSSVDGMLAFKRMCG